MVELNILVEGQSEQGFVREVLAPHLAPLGVYAHAWLVGKPGHKGGNSFSRAHRDLCAALRQRSNTHCTTMFDYFRLLTDWPGYDEARREPAARGVEILAAHLHRAIVAEIGDADRRFIPYFQLHEFEALLFADPAILAQALAIDPARVEAIVASFGGCEAINTDKGPSKHIEGLAPRFRKTTDGPLIALEIGVATLRARCPHFAAWLGRLEALGGH